MSFRQTATPRPNTLATRDASISDRLRALTTRHLAIQSLIEKERQSLRPDGMTLQRLKRLRLRTKDSISRLARITRSLGNRAASSVT